MEKSSRWALATLGAVIFTAYYWTITAGTWKLFQMEILGDVPDLLAQNFLVGRADVPLNAIGNEAWIHKGKAHMYFGPFVALLRLPLLMFGPGMLGLWSRASCLLAAALSVFFTARLFRRRPGNAFSIAMVTTGIAFGSPIFYLTSTAYLYHEAILWGLAFSTGAIAFFFDEDFRKRRPVTALATLSFFTAGALLSRLTFGLPLLALTFAHAVMMTPPFSKRLPALLPLAAAGLFICWYNVVRFGSPFTTLPMQSYSPYLTRPPSQIPEVFDFARFFISLFAYFFPSTPFSVPARGVTFDPIGTYVEWVIPLSLGSPWLLALAGLGAVQLWKQKGELLLKLCFSAFALESTLVLIFIFVTERYMADFLPLFLFSSACFFRWEPAWFAGSVKKYAAVALSALVLFSAAVTVSGTYFISTYWNWGVRPEFRARLHGLTH